MHAVFPDLTSRAMDVDVAYINRCVGVELGAPAIADLLSRMALTAKAVRDGQAVSVEVPPTRSDVLHACDVMEVGLYPLCYTACWLKEHVGHASAGLWCPLEFASR